MLGKFIYLQIDKTWQDGVKRYQFYILNYLKQNMTNIWKLVSYFMKAGY